jgi:hypothetical protein
MVDETGQAYAYAGDDPVNESDPSGMAAGHLSPDATCQYFRNMPNCQAVVTAETGGVPCSDLALASQTGPEALGLALLLGTGGIGDAIEALGGTADLLNITAQIKNVPTVLALACGELCQTTLEVATVSATANVVVVIADREAADSTNPTVAAAWRTVAKVAKVLDPLGEGATAGQ